MAFDMASSAPSRQRWTVLSGLFLVYMASNGITLHTLPLLYPELMETFGWREGEVTLPATVFFIVGALTSPPAGWLLDRYSARGIIAIGSALLALALVAYSATATLWQLVAIYALHWRYPSAVWFRHGHAHGLVSDRARSRYRHPADGIKPGGALFPLAVGTALNTWVAHTVSPRAYASVASCWAAPGFCYVMVQTVQQWTRPTTHPSRRYRNGYQA